MILPISKLFVVISSLTSFDSFFSNLDRIAHKNYTPTEEDILRIRVKTCGVTESEVSIGKDRFRFIDVGGQRSERRKWIYCFEVNKKKKGFRIISIRM